MNRERALEASEVLFERIRPMLGGFAPEAQGAALAQLLALWVAGFVSDDPATEDEAREEMLSETLELVRRLVPVMYAQHVRRRR